MALNPEDVRKIATLARLRFTSEQEATLADQLGRIVGYIDQLQKIDATEAPWVGGASREAADLPWPCLSREAFLANAPATFDAFLLVPEVKGGAGDDGVG